MRTRSLTIALALCGWATMAGAAPVTFTKLTGVTGGVIAGTAVFKADLSAIGLAEILSLTLTDSHALGGATGQFSGFDLDAIRLSTDDCATAACAAAATPAGVFNFGGSVFNPGTQRPIIDPKLFGTGPVGTTVDTAVATLGAFDGESIAGPGAAGFISLGDGGQIAVNLLGGVSTAGLFLYIGEVGDNLEFTNGRVTVADTPVPEPVSLALLGLGLLAVARRRPR